jgi:tetratricopeptide (TPR) repeat protein
MKRTGITRRGIKLIALLSIIFGLFTGCAANMQKVKAPEAGETTKKKAMDLFIEGKVAESSERIGDAIASYMEALQYDPRSGEIALALGQAFARSGKIKSALHYTELATGLNPANPDAWQLLQRIQQHEGNFPKAIEALEMYMKLTSDKDFNDVLKLSYFYFSTGKQEKAKSVLMNSIKEKNTPAEDMQEAAKLLIMNDLIDDALSIFNRIIERDPADVDAWIKIGEIYSDQGRKEEAEQIFKRAMEKNPDSSRLMVAFGNYCLGKNDWDCAISYFEQADAAGVNNIQVNKTLCALYFYAGRDDRGKAAFDSLKAKGEDDASLYFSLGKTMTYLDRYQEAVDYYRTGFSKADKTVKEESLINAYSGMARALIKLNRSDEAISLIHSEANTVIEDKTALKLLEANIYMEMKRYNDAIAILEWLSSSDPKNISYLLKLSLVYDMADIFEKAEKALLEVLKLEPEQALALNNLAYMYMEHNQHLDKAITMVKRALASEPDNGAYLDTLGWGYFKKGNYKEARKYIEAALKVADAADRGVIYEHYGDILTKMGKSKEAIEAYKSAIKLGEDSERIQPKLDALE